MSSRLGVGGGVTQTSFPTGHPDVQTDTTVGVSTRGAETQGREPGPPRILRDPCVTEVPRTLPESWD